MWLHRTPTKGLGAVRGPGHGGGPTALLPPHARGAQPGDCRAPAKAVAAAAGKGLGRGKHQSGPTGAQQSICAWGAPGGAPPRSGPWMGRVSWDASCWLCHQGRSGWKQRCRVSACPVHWAATGFGAGGAQGAMLGAGWGARASRGGSARRGPFGQEVGAGPHFGVSASRLIAGQFDFSQRVPMSTPHLVRARVKPCSYLSAINALMNET